MKKRLRSVAKEEEAGRGGGRPSQSGTALLRGPAMKQGLRCRSQRYLGPGGAWKASDQVENTGMGKYKGRGKRRE